jgi:transcriptional regulator with XRE-family HTH domain
MDLDLLRAHSANLRVSWGHEVRARRTQLGLTLAQVSELTDGSLRAQTLHKIETGEIEPREYMKLAVAIALMTEVDTLFPPTSRAEALRLLKAVA